MAIADPRFAAELATAKRMVYVLDDVGCLLAFVRQGTAGRRTACLGPVAGREARG